MLQKYKRAINCYQEVLKRESGNSKAKDAIVELEMEGLVHDMATVFKVIILALKLSFINNLKELLSLWFTLSSFIICLYVSGQKYSMGMQLCRVLQKLVAICTSQMVAKMIIDLLDQWAQKQCSIPILDQLDQHYPSPIHTWRQDIVKVMVFSHKSTK